MEFSYSIIDVAKAATGMAIGYAASKIVEEIVYDNVEAETRGQRAALWIGKVGITMVVKDLVQDSVDARFDQLGAVYKIVRLGIKEKAAALQAEEILKSDPSSN